MILLSFLRFQCIYKYNNINKYLYEYLKIEKKKYNKKHYILILISEYFRNSKFIFKYFLVHLQLKLLYFTLIDDI